ncbi:MAG: hypothetical protein IPM54_10820 [Polyangiaceae bacterium]|nr:hypothetical protein [Polyangiaceae bacterium]
MTAWLRFLWVAWALVLRRWACSCALVLVMPATNASAAPAPVEVCWRPDKLAADTDTFVIVKDTKGWREVGAWKGTRTDHHLVYKHNPNLGPDSLNRFPEDIRKIAWTCKRAPAVQPPPAADPPPPPPPPKPPPPKKTTPKPQKKSASDGPKPLPQPIARPAQKPVARPEQPRKAPSVLPGGERLLPKDELARVLPDAKDASPLPRPSLSHFAVNCADEKARCKRDAELSMPAELRATLTAILAQSCRDNARPDPRYAGQTYRDPLQQLETKLLVAALRWAGEQLAEPRVIPPQPREILPLPKLVVQKPVAQDDALSLEDPRVQFGGGLVSGGASGAVPFGSAGAEVAIQLRLLPKGTYWAQVGRACGEIAVGTGQIVLGCTGMGAGAGMSSTGGGAIVGVPIAAGSFAIATNGCATLANGVRNAGQLLSEGAPPDAPPAPSQVKLLEPKAKPSAQAPPPQGSAATRGETGTGATCAAGDEDDDQGLVRQNDRNDHDELVRYEDDDATAATTPRGACGAQALRRTGRRAPCACKEGFRRRAKVRSQESTRHSQC